MTEKAKREFSKAVGPKKQFLTVEEREKEVVESIPVEHREVLQEIVKEFRDVFPEKLPKGPPPPREVVHSIEVQPSSETTYQTPYRLRPDEQDEL